MNKFNFSHIFFHSLKMLEYFVIAFAIFMLFVYLTADHFLNNSDWNGSWKAGSKIFHIKRNGNILKILHEDYEYTGIIDVGFFKSDKWMEIKGQNVIGRISGNSMVFMNKSNFRTLLKLTKII